MDVVDVDGLSVLPGPASAGAGFARAVDVSRDRDERQKQLRPLTTKIASAESSTFVGVDATGIERGCVRRPQPRCAESVFPEMTPSQPAQAGLGEVVKPTCVLRLARPPFVPGGPCGG